NWSGPAADMSLPVSPSVVLSPQPPPPGVSEAVAAQYVLGPRIQVFEQSKTTQGDRLDLVFDSGVPTAARQRFRLFTYDARRGVAGGDQYVAQADLGPNQYTIDYGTGIITFSDRDPTLQETRQGGSQDLLVRYQFQTNLATDVVRATYTTRNLMSAQLGLIQY